ncbi:MAG: transposase, partial [Hyphomicrobiales bacterium]|nr:transposase [Hyphomicrobiales bacterium]
MRRFLLHVLPDGFHRIRHYGFLAGAARVDTVARIRQMLADAAPQVAENADKRQDDPAEALDDEREISFKCRCCGGSMTIVERFARGADPQMPFAAAWSDTS